MSENNDNKDIVVELSKNKIYDRWNVRFDFNNKKNCKFILQKILNNTLFDNNCKVAKKDIYVFSISNDFRGNLNNIKCGNIDKIVEELFLKKNTTTVSIQIDLKNKKEDIIKSFNNTLNEKENIDGKLYKPTNIIKITEESVDKTKMIIIIMRI